MDHPYQLNEFIKLEPADCVTYAVEEALSATSYTVTSHMSRVTESKKEPADYVMYGVEEASSETSYSVASQLPRVAETKVKQEIKPDPFVTQIKTETNPYSEDTKIKLEPIEETDTNEDINIKLEQFIADEINVKNETDVSSVPKRSDCSNGCTHKEDIIEETKIATFDLLPAKSKEKYEREFKNFDNWRKSRNVHGVNEDVMLAYFYELRNSNKESTFWTRYSMLKSTLKVNENVDLSRFRKLTAYLKLKSRIYKPKKAKSLERKHIEQFLAEAPDKTYLMMKVVLIMGISGACRCEELVKLSIDDIEDKGSYLLVTLPDTKTNTVRRFTVLSTGYATNVLDIYKKYTSLRPYNVGHRRFFLNYKKEKCTIQPVGINAVAKVPKEIANYLNLPEAESYTGHSFRCSSATLLANAGGDVMTLKRHDSWKSSSIAAGTLERKHIERFLAEAPDETYLMMKVVLIMGVSGACCCEELVKLTIDDIEDKGLYLLVTLPDIKTNQVRTFTVLSDGYAASVLDIYKKYASLRPYNVGHRRFFLNYKKEKCTIQPVGINMLARVPKEIANYLNLPKAETYTGHSFRRSSATFLANAECDVMSRNGYVSWKTSSVSEGYVEDSVANKIEIAKKIMGGKSSSTSIKSTSTENIVNEAINCEQFAGIHFDGDIERVKFYIHPGVKKEQDPLSLEEQDPLFLEEQD